MTTNYWQIKQRPNAPQQAAGVPKLNPQDRPAFMTGGMDAIPDERLTLEQRARTFDPQACYEYALQLYIDANGCQTTRGRAVRYMGIAAMTMPEARAFLSDMNKHPMPKPNMDVVGGYRFNLNPEITTDTMTGKTTEVYWGRGNDRV